MMEFKNMVIYFIAGGTGALIFSSMSNTVYKFMLIAILLVIAILIDKKNKSKK